jgi:2-oxo-4-hydroxy-4-carboxy-5-ureidoimidazoline decarboxylase
MGAYHVRRAGWFDGRMANPAQQASGPASLEAFNAAPAQDAERSMLACCSSGTFAKAVAGGRPYPDPQALRSAVNAAFATLSWDDILESLSEHPRIGDRAGGWSAAEQSGAASAGEQVRRALAEGNRAYEERFGHVFLICASGRSGQEMLDQLRARLENDPEAERVVVRDELLEITQLRLTKLLGKPGGMPAPPV